MEFSIASTVWFLIGAAVVYFFMKNKTSVDPHSLKDEVADIKRYIDNKMNDLEGKMHRAQPAQPVIVQAPATNGVQTTEKVELNAQSVEVFNNRADADTSTTSGAKAFGDAGIDNDSVLNIKPKE